jgi:hypothetical protein
MANMNAFWRRLGCGLLVVALSGAGAGCGDDDDDDDGNQAGTGGSSTAGKGGSGGAGASGGTGGSGGSSTAGKGGSGGSGGTGGSGGSVACGSAGPLSAECVTCIKSMVSACGNECVALLNCSANKCAAATDQASQQACVSMCCLTEATTAVGVAGGREALGAAQMAQRAQCAAMCSGGDADGGI